jgi:NADH-quinone oxidoreductase subunit E
MQYRCGSCGKVWEGKEWRSSCPRCGETVIGVPPSPRRPDDPEKLIQFLLSLQREKGWLPREVLREASRRLGVPLARVYQVATFYKAFSLAPRGRNLLRVCMGTSCQVRGSQMILERISGLLGISPGETTPDLQFTLETVNCLGCCAIGPVMMVNDKYFGNLNVSQIGKILEAQG